jgi:hypothetical protein
MSQKTNLILTKLPPLHEREFRLSYSTDIIGKQELLPPDLEPILTKPFRNRYFNKTIE